MNPEPTTPSVAIHPPHPLLIVISGPSGVGKDSVLEEMKARGLPFHFVITATTRKPRADEVDGVDYFFLSQDEFAKMIDEADWIGDYDRADTLHEEYATISEHRDRGDVWYPAF